MIWIAIINLVGYLWINKVLMIHTTYPQAKHIIRLRFSISLNNPLDYEHRFPVAL